MDLIEVSSERTLDLYPGTGAFVISNEMEQIYLFHVNEAQTLVLSKEPSDPVRVGLYSPLRELQCLERYWDSYSERYELLVHGFVV